MAAARVSRARRASIAGARDDSGSWARSGTRIRAEQERPAVPTRLAFLHDPGAYRALTTNNLVVGALQEGHLHWASVPLQASHTCLHPRTECPAAQRLRPRLARIAGALDREEDA